MGPDLSIYSGYMREPKSVNEYRAEADAQELNALRLMLGKQEAEVGQMKMDETRRGVADQNALRGIYAQFGDDQEANYNALMKSGRADAAGAYRKQLLDAQEAQAKIGKVGAETRNTEQDAIKKRMEFYKGHLDTIVNTPTIAQQWVKAQYQDPILGPVMAGMFPLEEAISSIGADPQAFEQWRKQAAMGMTQFMTDQRGRATQAETGRHNLASEANTVRGQNVTARGQDMTDARARDANETQKALVTQEKELKIHALRDKADERARSKAASIASAAAQIAVIDKALTHPGRETATGVSGSMDPRNYIPGTDARNFQVVLDQINGSAFLQAFETLKGGGQITEVEGNKATAAIARLNRAQSDSEFKSSRC